MFINEENKKTFQAIILLNELINNPDKYVTTDSDIKLLEPLLVQLMAKGYVTTAGNKYVAAAKGHETYDTFMKRYDEFLRLYDIFAYVDLDKGEFAFNHYFDFDTDAEWDNFKNDPRFEDVRIAVATFKKIDPAEIVFMAFINEDRFDTSRPSWAMDLLSGSIWDEIENICAEAITPEELGQDAMEDMISQGSQLMVALLQKEKELQQQSGSEDSDNEYTEETIAYYEPYYDPLYVSPIWLAPLFLW